MKRVSIAAVEAARELWAHSGVDAPEADVPTIELGFARLRVGLSRWIGADGYRVLLQRVLAEVGVEHPELAGLDYFSDGNREVAFVARTNGDAAQTIGIVSAVALLIHLLSQVIGEEMAMRLVQQAWSADPNEAASVHTRGVSDG